jgi:signal transduction histidine kinase
VQLNDCIRGTFTVLGRQLEVHGINVELTLDDSLPPIKGDRNRLEQVFLNLIMNARDALDEKEAQVGGGPVEKVLRIRSYLEGSTAVATVTDTGVGMSEAVRAKIFEPFYTTKPVGKGTGLGLSISFGIVRDYNGTIEVESKQGSGTTFKLSFPVVEAENSEIQEVAVG